MEEWVGQQWHRFITRAADRQHAAAAVNLPEMERAIGLLFRAGGGPATVRVSSAAARRVGGSRNLLQRIAGSGTHADLPRLEPEALALPARIAVFPEAALNRSLYLWLAALAACGGHGQPGDGWIGTNRRATRSTLQR
ncbi:MAG TPA: VWA domain-containing protein, partial [Burkholderiaceae bacterium]|nr:VWA domain-containing protein [Burkholderiaceae bacterium]